VYGCVNIDSREKANGDKTESEMMPLKKLLYELGIDYTGNRLVYVHYDNCK